MQLKDRLKAGVIACGMVLSHGPYAVRVFFVLSLCLTSSLVRAQYGETIRSGRPGQAIGPFTLGKNVFQHQMGLDFGQTREKPAKEITQNVLLQSNVFRYGFTEYFEVSSALNFQSDRFVHSNDSLSTTRGGLQTLSIRARSNIREGKGLSPTLGMQFNLSLPVTSPAYRFDYLAPRLILMSGQRFRKWGLTTNWGIIWNGNIPEPSGFYVLNLSREVGKRFSLFIENYGFLVKDNLSTNFDGGIAFLVNKDLQIDFFGGYDKSDVTAWFASIGVSWRIKFNEKTSKI